MDLQSLASHLLSSETVEPFAGEPFLPTEIQSSGFNVPG
jgi:hypothetical protein